MSEQRNIDWTPIGLPDDPAVLADMLVFEKRFGGSDIAEVIEAKLDRVKAKKAGGVK